MDEFQKRVYGLEFTNRFHTSKGDAFQSLFSAIMEKRHGTDFTRLRAWGNKGDKKNDGHLTSSKTVFQCYAPNDMKSAAAIAKIEEDFEGAVRHWLPHMAEWIFVHNSVIGLAPDVHKKLLELSKNKHGVKVTHWGIEELRHQVLGLGVDALSDLFGAVPTPGDFVQLGFEDLRQVLESIETVPPIDEGDVRPVPPDKLSHNRLSADIAYVLQQGMAKSDLVSRYLESLPDALAGDRIAQRISQRYQQLRGAGHSPDEVFFQLQVFVGGSTRGLPRREAAIYSVMAFFFEQCDIFERPPGPQP